MNAGPHWTSGEWSAIERAARQVRTYRAYAAAGAKHGNEPQRLAMAGSASDYEREVRRFARSALRAAGQQGGRP